MVKIKLALKILNIANYSKLHNKMLRSKSTYVNFEHNPDRF